MGMQMSNAWLDNPGLAASRQIQWPADPWTAAQRWKMTCMAERCSPPMPSLCNSAAQLTTWGQNTRRFAKPRSVGMQTRFIREANAQSTLILTGQHKRQWDNTKQDNAKQTMGQQKQTTGQHETDNRTTQNRQQDTGNRTTQNRQKGNTKHSACFETTY